MYLLRNILWLRYNASPLWILARNRMEVPRWLAVNNLYSHVDPL